MTTNNYRNGAARERYQKRKLEKEGLICLRTAGSKGFADLIAINRKDRIIRFIQVKPRNYSNPAKLRLLEDYKWLNDSFKVRFEVL